MSTDAHVHEDTALVAVLTEQVGALNTLVTRFRLRADAAEARVRELEAALAAAPAPRTQGSAPVSAPATSTVAPSLGRGDISVSLGGSAAESALAARVDGWDELLGEVRLL